MSKDDDLSLAQYAAKVSAEKLEKVRVGLLVGRSQKLNANNSVDSSDDSSDDSSYDKVTRTTTRKPDGSIVTKVTKEKRPAQHKQSSAAKHVGRAQQEAPVSEPKQPAKLVAKPSKQEQQPTQPSTLVAQPKQPLQVSQPKQPAQCSQPVQLPKQLARPSLPPSLPVASTALAAARRAPSLQVVAPYIPSLPFSPYASALPVSSLTPPSPVAPCVPALSLASSIPAQQAGSRLAPALGVAPYVPKAAALPVAPYVPKAAADLSSSKANWLDHNTRKDEEDDSWQKGLDESAAVQTPNWYWRSDSNWKEKAWEHWDDSAAVQARDWCSCRGVARAWDRKDKKVKGVTKRQQKQLDRIQAWKMKKWKSRR